MGTTPDVNVIGTVGVWHGGAFAANPTGLLRDAASEIEDLGYGSLWMAEALSKDVFALSAIVLAATEQIVVGTGIANVWARGAATAYGGAQTLAEAYEGRFVLGLGVSHQPLAHARGQSYEKPLAVMRSYLEAYENAPYHGPRPGQRPRLVLAALRRRMLELARDKTDGAHPYFVPTDHTARAREVLGSGPLLIPEQAVVLESDPERARQIARHHTSSYLRMDNYANSLRELGFTEQDLADGGSDRLVDAIVAWGSVDRIRDRVREHLDAGANHVLIQPLDSPGGNGLALGQLRELAPALVHLGPSS